MARVELQDSFSDHSVRCVLKGLEHLEQSSSFLLLIAMPRFGKKGPNSFFSSDVFTQPNLRRTDPRKTDITLTSRLGPAQATKTPTRLNSFKRGRSTSSNDNDGSV